MCKVEPSLATWYGQTENGNIGKHVFSVTCHCI